MSIDASRPDVAAPAPKFVIGDGAEIADRTADSLTETDLLRLHRSLVLLRLDDDVAEAARSEAKAVMREAIGKAEGEPPADPSLLFEHAYANPPASLALDLTELRRVLARE